MMSGKKKSKSRNEFDSHSTMSAASKGSDRKKSRRFSLRRIFYGPRSKSAKSHSSLEFETRSELSIATYPERDLATPSVKSIDTFNASTESTHECPLCLSIQPRENFPRISTCPHRSCLDCLRQYLKIEITESRINISCPECSERFHPNDIKVLLNDSSLMDKYEQFMLRRVLVLDSDTRWCPAPDCGYAVIAQGCAGCPKIRCERPGCNTYFCYHCKQQWHPNQTCDSARAKRLPNLRLRSASISLTNALSHKDDIKPCPRCGAFIVKMDDGSCNHMTCAVCGAEFCWLCMKEISDLHYLSPSGCTFWGKKPWSRKKKILWQLGTLVGAPVGISLVAGIAVPAIIIGVPVWVGRKLHAKYEYTTRHKRNLITTGGVAASIIASPLLAGLAIGIGVPILLAYVYGVVPISLCRSGGCGVHTSNSGVRFEFDDENDVTVNPSVTYSGDNRSVDTTSHVNIGNPSLGPSIGEASMGMTNSLSVSGSHLEREGDDDSDHRSASHQAIAGASLSGSLNGSAVLAHQAFHNRLEVHADVSNNANLQKRASFSSDSANLSIGDKMSVAYMHLTDDASSTRALAGSIGGGRDKDSLILPSLEIKDEKQADSFSLASAVRGQVQRSEVTCQQTSDTCPKSCKESPRQHRRKDLSGQSSPPSGRSVTFFDGEVPKHRRPRHKNTESKMVSGHDQTAIMSRHQSLENDETVNKNAVSLTKSRHQSIESSQDLIPSISITKSNKTKHLNSGQPDEEKTDVELTEICSASNAASSARAAFLSSVDSCLPEVESDKPCSFYLSKMVTKSVQVDEEVSALCNIVEEKRNTIPDNKSSADHIHSKINRRLSCELAIKHGRLSPNAYV